MLNLVHKTGNRSLHEFLCRKAGVDSLDPLEPIIDAFVSLSEEIQRDDITKSLNMGRRVSIPDARFREIRTIPIFAGNYEYLHAIYDIAES